MKTTHDSQEVIHQCAALLEHLDELLGAYEPLSPYEVRRMPRMALHREDLVPELATLCREAGIDGGGVGSLDEMSRSSDELNATRRLLERLDLVRARLDAKRHRAAAVTTRNVHLFYELARRAATYDDAIRERVTPIVERFRTRRTTKKRFAG
jgi:hypothetical protein